MLSEDFFRPKAGWPLIFNKTINYSFYLLFFLVPLAFSPVNFELFEYPKMMLVYGLTAVITTAWLGKMFVQGRIYVKKTPLDIPILLFLLSSVLSTFLSIDRYTSLWGYYSRSHGGLMSTICYILLYYAFVSNTDRKKVLFTIYSLLFTASLVAGYGILERLGIDKDYWVQDVQNRVFSTLGQPNWLGAMLVAIIFIPLGFLLQQWNNETMKQYKSKKITLYYLLFAVYFLCLIFTNSKSAILAFWICFILFISLILYTNKKLIKIALPFLLLTILIYSLLGQKTYSYIKKAPNWVKIFTGNTVVNPSSANKPELNYKPSISESSEIRKVVWKGAINIWKHYPVFGSGVETFGYAYYNHRPVEHNLLSEWDFLYNRAHNEFLNILACQGLVGITTYLFLIGAFLYWAGKEIKKLRNEEIEGKEKKKFPNALISQYLNILISLIAGYASILITNFFGFSVVIIGLLFFMIPAFCFAGAKTEEKQLFTWKFYSTCSAIACKVKRFSCFKITLLLILFFSLLFILYSLLNRWRADFHFAKGEKFYKTNYLIPALTSLEKSVLLNPKEALYHAYLAKTSTKMAIVYAEATESAEISSQLADLAEQEINKALTLNSVHLNFYKNRAEVYIFLSTLNPSLRQKAIKTLVYASKLAPTDAKILYNLGLLYKQEEELEKTVEVLEKAVVLKPNYLKAYLELAEIYQEAEQIEKARKSLEFILKNIDSNNKQALEMINTLIDSASSAE